MIKRPRIKLAGIGVTLIGTIYTVVNYLVVVFHKMAIFYDSSVELKFWIEKLLIGLMLFMFFENGKKAILSHVLDRVKEIKLKKMFIWSLVLNILIWYLEFINFENNKLFLILTPIVLISFTIFVAVTYYNVKRRCGSINHKKNFFTAYMSYIYFPAIFMAYSSKVIISFLENNEVKLEVMQIIPRFYFILVKVTTMDGFILMLIVVFIIMSVGELMIRIPIKSVIKERVNYTIKILLSFFVSLLWLFFLQTYLLIIDMFNVGEIKDVLGPKLSGEIVDKSLIITVLSLHYVASLIVIKLIKEYLVQNDDYKSRAEMIKQRYNRGKRRYRN